MPELLPADPGVFFALLTGYQRTGALKAAVDLELFTAIAEGANTTRALARIALGSQHGCVQRATGAILCWGLNAAGQLGEADVHQERAAGGVDLGVVAARLDHHKWAASLSPRGFLFTIRGLEIYVSDPAHQPLGGDPSNARRHDYPRSRCTTFRAPSPNHPFHRGGRNRTRYLAGVRAGL